MTERFINVVSPMGISVLSIQSFPQTGGSSLHDDLVANAISLTQQSGARVILLSLISSDLRTYFRMAMKMGFVGPPLNYIFTDGGTTSTTPSAYFHSTDVNFTESLKPYSMGWIGTSPTLPSGPLWEDFVSQWLSADPMEYPGCLFCKSEPKNLPKMI